MLFLLENDSRYKWGRSRPVKKQNPFWILWMLTDSCKWSKRNINGSGIVHCHYIPAKWKEFLYNKNNNNLIIALHFIASLMDCSTLASMSWMCHQIEASFKASDYKIPVHCIEKTGQPMDLCILAILHFR